MKTYTLNVIRTILLVVVITGFNVSCEDALQEEVYSFVSTDNYWQTADDAEAGIIGAYESFLSQNYWGRFFFEVTELVGDQVNINRNETYLTLDRWDIIPNHPFVSNLWNIMYQQIGRANGVIQNVPDIEMDEQEKNAIIAEAKVLRAYNYFNLVRLWGGVPLSLTIAEKEEDAYLPRATVEEVYAQIEKDLTEAENALPLTRGEAEIGRVTSGTAKTLLAWVYLTQEKWQEAASKAKEVMDQGPYELQESFSEIFSGPNENNSEIIFSVQFDGATRGNALASFSHAGGTQNPNCTNGVRVYSVDNQSDIWQNWDEDEPRRNFTVYQTFIGINGDTVDVGAEYPGFGKWNAPAETGINNCYLNPVILRYADVLLIFAEASSQANAGPTAEAYEAINQVRRRAYGLPIDQPSEVDLTGLSPQAFRDAVIEERGFEFVMEGKRIFDLMRLGIFKETLKALGKPATAGDLYPIPQSEIDANPLIDSEDQNPGYAQ